MSKRTTCTACGEHVDPRGPRMRTPIRCDDCKAEHRRRYIRARSRRLYAENVEFRQRRMEAAQEFKAAHPESPTARLERKRRYAERDKIRHAARDEARERGVPVDQILREWRA